MLFHAQKNLHFHKLLRVLRQTREQVGPPPLVGGAVLDLGLITGVSDPLLGQLIYSWILIHSWELAARFEVI